MSNKERQGPNMKDIELKIVIDPDLHEVDIDKLGAYNNYTYTYNTVEDIAKAVADYIKSCCLEEI